MKFINFGDEQMTQPRLTKCCRRFSLKLGCKIVVWYSLISNIFGIVNGFYNLVDISYFQSYPEIAADLVLLKIIFCILDASFSALLLIGYYKEKPILFLYWLIAKSILLLSQIPLYVLMSTFDKLCDEMGFLLIFMGVDIYCVLVVHGYFIETTTTNPGESEV